MTSLDSGDTAWLLVSSALVLLMAPGLALFRGGLLGDPLQCAGLSYPRGS